MEGREDFPCKSLYFSTGNMPLLMFYMAQGMYSQTGNTGNSYLCGNVYNLPKLAGSMVLPILSLAIDLSITMSLL